MSKKIEPAGHFYAKLQGKIYRASQRKLAADGVRDKRGKKIEVEDSEEDEELKGAGSDEEAKAKEKDYGKKRKAKTKEEIQKEALLMENLYAALGLEDKTYEASENDISKAYKKMALKYHPDKLGANYSEQDKQIWLQV